MGPRKSNFLSQSDSDLSKKKTFSYSNNFPFYIITSLLFGLVIVVVTSKDPSSFEGFLHDFTNAHPKRGEAGIGGRFLIRGQHPTTSFAYAWRLVSPTIWSRATAWMGYMVHQLGHWWIVYRAQAAYHAGEIKWAREWNKYGIWMAKFNGIMCFWKLLQGLVFYDGLAQDVPEGTSLASVCVILVLVLCMEIPRRGLFFGHARTFFGNPVTTMELVTFVKTYHAYVISFGICYTFHYHPPESTLGHFSGFAYMALLMHQSNLLFQVDHKEKNWTTFLEAFVFLHGSLTAIFQGGFNWLLFFYGFLAVFAVTQIWGIPYLQRHFAGTLKVPIVLSGFIMVTLLGFWFSHSLHRLYVITFIPIAEFSYVLFYWISWLVCQKIVRALEAFGVKGKMQKWIIVSMYVIVNGLVVLGYSIQLGGKLVVYNDY